MVTKRLLTSWIPACVDDPKARGFDPERQRCKPSHKLFVKSAVISYSFQEYLML